MFSSRVMTDFSSPQKLYFVLMPQNRHQRATSTVTRLLVRQARRLAIPTTANQAAQTELASNLKSRSQTDCESGNETCMAREILRVHVTATGRIRIHIRAHIARVGYNWHVAFHGSGLEKRGYVCLASCFTPSLPC